MPKTIDFDLVIVGAGSMGLAAAFYAVTQQSVPASKVCLIDSAHITRVQDWDSRFSAQPFRIHSNEPYLTNFLVEAAEEWKRLDDYFRIRNKAKALYFYTNRMRIFHQEGSIWFGEKGINAQIGNIRKANACLTLVNAKKRVEETRLAWSFMEKIQPGFPDFMGIFKQAKKNDQQHQIGTWQKWGALYQADGGAIDTKTTYNYFLNFLQQEGVIILDRSHVSNHIEGTGGSSFGVLRDGKSITVRGKKVFIAVGPSTPHFLKQVMNVSHLIDYNSDHTEFTVQEKVNSYFKIKESSDGCQAWLGTGLGVHSYTPSFYHFMTAERQQTNGAQSEVNLSGFRYHCWDNPTDTTSRLMKIGTTAKRLLSECSNNDVRVVDASDWRVRKAIKYAKEYISGLLPEHEDNKHFAYKSIHYVGRETILDYLNRNNKSIVVQSGGQTGYYHAYLAKVAMKMLFQPDNIDQERREGSVVGNFISRTRFPIKNYVKQRLAEIPRPFSTTHFNTIVVGAGCSGLYSAYRLNKHQPASESLAVFEMSSRISGRLKSFNFQGVSTPMELGGMRYIPTNHQLLCKLIGDLGIPHVDFPMDGDPIQDYARKAYLRDDYYHVDDWMTKQQAGQRLITAYRLKGAVVGMQSAQIISFSLYMIITAPQNIHLLSQVFLMKTDAQIDHEKSKRVYLNQFVPCESSFYRNWRNFVYRQQNNPLNYVVQLGLKEWNLLKPSLVMRYPMPVQQKDVIQGFSKAEESMLHPLYKFGFQNVIETQFGHQAYQFVSEHNGYFSNTSNAAYLDQVMTYLLDFSNVQYRTLVGGFDSINYALTLQLLNQKKGLQTRQGGIYLDHRLVDIKKEQDKYKVTLHAKKLMKTTQIVPIRKKTHLNSIYGLYVPLEEADEWGNILEEVSFTANRIILAMPKRAIQILANDIKLLRKPLTNYMPHLQVSQKQVQELHSIPTRQKFIEIARKTQEMTGQDMARLHKLLKKQEESSANAFKQLDFSQQDQLENLSRRQFLKSLAVQNIQCSSSERKALFIWDGPLIPRTLRSLTDSVQLMPVIKVLINFTCSWWDPHYALNKKHAEKYPNIQLTNSVEEMRGRSITDLPTRQTLYFTEGDDHLMLACYNDMSTTSFWNTLHDNFKEEFKGQGQRRVSYDPDQEVHRAKKVFMEQLLHQLSLIHNIKVKEEWVKECVYQFWGKDPYGAGYHNFYSGYDIPSVMRCLRKPWLEENIHIVGEAFSNEPGWVQGAFQTTERFLQEEMKLPALVPGYYAGY